MSRLSLLRPLRHTRADSFRRRSGTLRPGTLRPGVLGPGIVLACAAVSLAGCGSSAAPSAPGSGNVLPSGAAAATGPSTLGATAPPAASGGVVTVVAGENFWGDITSQIGGSHVKVTSIITDPNTDPHVYETDPKDAAAITGAQLVIENGVGYDDFIDKIIATAPSSSRRLLSVAKTLGVRGDNPNPHLWYDLDRVPQVATAIAGQLAAVDPSHAADYSAGARTFISSLAPVRQVVTEISSKYRGTAVGYTERVPGYLISDAGLKVGTPSGFSQAVEDDNDPSPADTAAFDATLTGHTIRALLYNNQVTDAVTDKVKALAASSKVPVVGVSETIPPTDATYQAWQLRQDSELLKALGG